MKLENRVALVTGAGSGLGEAAAKKLDSEGAKVALLSRTKEELEETAKKLTNESLILPADISNPDEVKDSIEKIIDKWGRLDIVYANAGINGVWAPLDELKPEEWRKTIDINLNGTFYTVKFASEKMKEKGGSIIITASINGTRVFTNTGASAYSSTKAAQVAFMKMTALELASHKIRVNAICPGQIESEIEDNTNRRDIDKEEEPVKFPEGTIPLTSGKPGESEDVGRLVLFLASDDSKHISGTEIFIDGTQSLLVG